MKTTLDALQWKISTPIAPLYLVATEKGLLKASWEKQNFPFLQSLTAGSKESTKQRAIILKASQEINEYFFGGRQKFTVPLDIHGTSFQQNVWKKLKQLRFGRTLSYKELAGKVDSPKAFRAVGNANGKNPLCIIIPCHRVISADGSLGGYSGGVHIKKKLLSLECSN